jgi:translocation and assembly module TamA
MKSGMDRARPTGRTGKRLIFLLALGAAIGAPAVRAAEPQPYTVSLGPTKDAALHAALLGASQLVALRAPAPAGPFALVLRARQDRERLRTVLESFGYYQAKIAITIDGEALDAPGLLTLLHAAPAAPPVPVKMTFDPGPQFRIGTVTLEGTVPAAARTALRLPAGAPALAAQVLAARDRLLGALRREGYALATVDLPPVVLDPVQHRMDVTFVVHSGPVVAFGPLHFTGDKGVNEAFLRRRLALRSGQRFSPEALSAARDSLLGLPIFSYVQAVPATELDPQGNLPVTFQLAERPVHAFDAGVDYSTDLGVGLTGGWHNRNMFGNAEQLDLTGAFQAGGNAVLQPGYRADAVYRVPDWRTRGEALELELGAVHQALIPYTQTAVTEAVRLQRQLAPHWSLTYGVAGEQETIVQEGVSRVYYLLRLPVWLRFDNTDSTLNPTRGGRAALMLTPTQSILGHGGVVVAQLSGAAYFDLEGHGRGVLALRGLAGDVLGASSAFTLPPDQRFYAGGSGTVRGYRFQSLGPQFPDGTPIGGTEILAGTVEFRQRVLKNWGFSIFSDVGGVNAAGSGAAAKFGVGVGVGLQYYTSIGPIRAEVAVPVIRTPNSGAFELYVGIGQAF